MFWRKTRPSLSQDNEDWQIACWSFLIQEFGPVDHDGHPGLVLPTPTFFPPAGKDVVGHEKAVHVLDTVKWHCGMAEWPCTLVAQSETPNVQLGDYIVAEPPFDPHGTFDASGNDVVISYNPALVDQPWQLIATLVHELAHYLLADKDVECPGGQEASEHAVDLTTAYLGFGLFSANAAFNIQQYGDAFSQGWHVTGGGYLGEPEWCFALAVFAALRDVDAGEFEQYLKPNLLKQVVVGQAHLEREPWIIDGIRKGDLHT